METYEVIGFVLAVIMGLTLGLFGGGGSILTVPILVYVFQLNPVLATAYSLFVVGFSALIGAIRKHFDGEIAYKIGFFFAIPSIVSVYATRRFLIPFIPDTLAQMGNVVLTKNVALMLFFAVVMLLAAYSMIKGRKERESQQKAPSYPLVVLEGVVVGVITGLVGAGGGFLIVPALVLLVGLSMKEAVATSLVIIALKSLIGFTGDLGSGQAMDWSFLMLFTAFSIAGMIAGLMLAKRINAQSLKKAFGYFVLLMAVFILLKELL